MQQVTIMDFIFKTLVFFGTVTIGSTDVETSGVCATPQYLDLGIIGTIQCSFRENFYGVYWYSSTDSANTYPLLTFQESEKGGDGYLSGEFDVFPNGSLIIKNVSLEDDHTFRVILLDSKDVDSVIHDIRVYVTVRSKQLHPYINICEEEPVCLVELQEVAAECSVAGTRPPVNLTWTVQHETTYWKVPYESEISSHNNLFTTNVKMTVPLQTSYVIQHFVCKAVDPPGILAGTESHLFLENANEHVSVGNPVTVHAKHEEKLTLSCLINGRMFLIWKRLLNDKGETIAHAVFGEKMYLKTYSDDYLLDSSGSLVIPHTVVSHEGIYMCMFSTSKNYSVKIFDVVVFVPPEPPSLIIKGCLPDEDCVLTVQEEGNITCAVKGIRPKIRLEWLTVSDGFPAYISFSAREQIIERVGDTFDLTLTSQYKLEDVSQKMLAVECRVFDWDKSIINLDKTVMLHFIDDQTTKERSSELIALLIVIPLSVVIFFVLLALVVANRRKFAHKKHNQETDEQEPMESGPKTEGKAQEKQDEATDEELQKLCPRDKALTHQMQDESTDSEVNLKQTEYVSENDDFTSRDIKKAFEKQLKSNYEELYTVLPLPCLSEQKCYVNEFFADRKLDIRITGNGMNEQWEVFGSHRDIFKRVFNESSRLVILRGEPNSGKSILTLQMLYDWCRPEEHLYLQKYEIFILMHFADLLRFKSIYEAIKSFLNPHLNLKVEDIEKLFKTCSTGLIILNGLHECQGVISQNDADIFKIVNGTMLENFHVIVITSLKVIPEIIDKKAIHFRLPYFDRRCQNSYVKKNGGDNFCMETAKKIIERNPLLKEVCGIPMIFASYVNIKIKMGKYFTSVYDLIDGMLSSTLEDPRSRNKDDTQLNKIYEIVGNIAYQRLQSHKGEQLLFKGDDFSELDNDVFHKFKSTGLLVANNIKHGDLPVTELENDDNVRFRHRIFFDWFVAYYLCSKVKETEFKTTLQTLDPHENKYILCFVCGNNDTYGQQVIKELKSEKAYKRELQVICSLELLAATEDEGRKEEIFQQVFPNRVKFQRQDEIFYQHAIVQKEQIATMYERGIEDLSIENSLKCDECSKDSLRLQNGLKIPVLHHLQSLNITLEGSVIGDEGFQAILQFAASCNKLKELRFKSCLLPHSLQNVPGEVKKRKVAAYWDPGVWKPLRLNIESGLWKEQDEHEDLSLDRYKNLKEKFPKKYNP